MSSLTQQEVSNRTGYSISAVSRALEQMVKLGSVTRSKPRGSRSYHYKTQESLSHMMIGGLQSWLFLTDKTKNDLSNIQLFAKDVVNKPLSKKEIQEIRHIMGVVKELQTSLDRIEKIMQEALSKVINV